MAAFRPTFRAAVVCRRMWDNPDIDLGLEKEAVSAASAMRWTPPARIHHRTLPFTAAIIGLGRIPRVGHPMTGPHEVRHASAGPAM